MSMVRPGVYDCKKMYGICPFKQQSLAFVSKTSFSHQSQFEEARPTLKLSSCDTEFFDPGFDINFDHFSLGFLAELFLLDKF